MGRTAMNEINVEYVGPIWVHRDKYCELSGITNGVIRGWIQRHFVHGVHYKVIGKQTMINIVAIDDWITNYEEQYRVAAAKAAEIAAMGQSIPKAGVSKRKRYRKNLANQDQVILRVK